MRFIDEVKIEVRAGHGGKGCTSFRREKYIPKGGPDGGDGGRGGHVIFVASGSRNTLQELYLRKRLIARNGQPGRGSDCHGKNGPDIIMQVPVGTLVKDEAGHVLADLTREGQEYYLARVVKAAWATPALPPAPTGPRAIHSPARRAIMAYACWS